jgi:alpha/beta superfamily hydrolase
VTRDLVVDEEPLFLTSGVHELFAVLTAPAVEARGVAVVLLWGSGAMPSFGPNRIRWRLARELAGLGYHALRLDYAGSGESTGDSAPLHDLGAPCVADVVAAIGWLASRGLSRIILLGTCFGARAALASVPLIEGLEGVVLLAPPVWDDDQRMAESFELSRLQPGSRIEWASPKFVTPLNLLVQREIPFLLVYGRDDKVYETFCQAQAGQLGQVLDTAGHLATLKVTDGLIHSFPTVAGQDDAIMAVATWLSGLTHQPDLN